MMGIPAKPSSVKSIALQTILHVNEVDKVWIEGEKVL